MFASLNLGSAQNPHVLRVRSGFSALSVFKLSSPITPTEQGVKDPVVQTMLI
ncbi:L-asparaginase [Citrobacter gillenii]|nr:L-asparaginase [Citrobacter gillenii]